MTDFVPTPDPAPTPTPPAQPAKRWAVVRGSTIINVVEASEPQPDAQELPEGSTAGPGWTWATNAPTPEPPAQDPRFWWIDIGPFFDRFGAAKMSLLMSTNALAVALRNDAAVRKYIDLKNPLLAQGLTALVAQNIAGVDAALRTAILAAPTTEAERHIKGLA
jgi:hypothetical protein